MTSTALRSSVVTRATPASGDYPAADSNNTRKSAVFEYACLFTHDIRRKNTKRWQDGYLRFHQFNSRIMVYDQSRNYIGDTHYHSLSSTGLEDGDELQLERGGVLVQVAEKLSVQETDLTDLLSKRTPKAPAAVISRPTPSNTRAEQSLPLNHVAARAHNPNRSPFEMRQNASVKISHNPPAERPRPTKRLRIDDEHVPLRQLLQGSTTSTSKREASAANNINPATSSRTRTLFDKTKSPTFVREDITQEQPAPQDDGEQTGLAPGTKTSISRRGGVFNSSSPPKAPSPASPPIARQSRGLNGGIASRKAQGQTETVSRRVSPPVSTTSHVQVDLAPEDPTCSSNKEANPTPSGSNEQKKKQKKPLRLATSAPRRKLLCHTLGTAITRGKQKENISPQPKAPPNEAELLPSAGVESPERPTPNPDLDFNISSILDEDLSFLSPTANKAAQEPNIPPPDPEPNPLKVVRDPPQPQTRSQRPFRRHASDTSPTKRKEPPTLQRAETISVPHEKQKQNLHTGARDAAEPEPEDSGPWSREAWDLLGWCPSGRGKILGWRYFDP